MRTRPCKSRTVHTAIRYMQALREREAYMKPTEKQIQEIDENWDDYFEFEGFESHESFKIMEDFAEIVEDTKLRNNLINALNRPKPFRNFKWQIDNSGDYRQQWFDFKKMQYIQWIKEQIDLNKKVFDE